MWLIKAVYITMVFLFIHVIIVYVSIFRKLPYNQLNILKQISRFSPLHELTNM